MTQQSRLSSDMEFSGISLMRNGIDDRAIQKFCLPEQRECKWQLYWLGFLVLLSMNSSTHEETSKAALNIEHLSPSLSLSHDIPAPNRISSVVEL
ncbi:hypothetical protein CDAR_80441 [Caerostris darwini]|uniref:Uncharacterized protein n=1 Tax=Caerostris darwini TaxID=1538125 RepID=A0AAV4NL31_9ARAC|nr:hypothetical protein CDAR_80441 [Caerostris darwini]